MMNFVFPAAIQAGIEAGKYIQQLNKMNPANWGDGTVLDKNKLDSEWKQKFEKAAERKYSPKRKDIESKALAELDPMYMVRLYDDFRKFVIEK